MISFSDIKKSRPYISKHYCHSQFNGFVSFQLRSHLWLPHILLVFRCFNFLGLREWGYWEIEAKAFSPIAFGAFLAIKCPLHLRPSDAASSLMPLEFFEDLPWNFYCYLSESPSPLSFYPRRYSSSHLLLGSFCPSRQQCSLAVPVKSRWHQPRYLLELFHWFHLERRDWYPPRWVKLANISKVVHLVPPFLAWLHLGKTPIEHSPPKISCKDIVLLRNL